MTGKCPTSIPQESDLLFILWSLHQERCPVIWSHLKTPVAGNKAAHRAPGCSNQTDGRKENVHLERGAVFLTVVISVQLISYVLCASNWDPHINTTVGAVSSSVPTVRAARAGKDTVKKSRRRLLRTHCVTWCWILHTSGRWSLRNSWTETGRRGGRRLAPSSGWIVNVHPNIEDTLYYVGYNV